MHNTKPTVVKKLRWIRPHVKKCRCKIVNAKEKFFI